MIYCNRLPCSPNWGIICKQILNESIILKRITSDPLSRIKYAAQCWILQSIIKLIFCCFNALDTNIDIRETQFRKQNLLDRNKPIAKDLYTKKLVNIEMNSVNTRKPSALEYICFLVSLSRRQQADNGFSTLVFVALTGSKLLWPINRIDIKSRNKFCESA